MSRTLPRLAIGCFFVAALIVTPWVWSSRTAEMRPTEQDRRWVTDRLDGRWEVRFMSGGSATWDLTVEQVGPPMRTFCDDELYSAWRWVNSAQACGTSGTGKARRAYSVMVAVKSRSETKQLDGWLRGVFTALQRPESPDDIHFTVQGGLDAIFHGTLEADGTVMRGPALDGPLSGLGTFEVRKVANLPPPAALAVPSPR
ncbi:hypothetical protein [Corallococcus terminator]|uniref:Uncharacterized protein n=1 Tax=Corallococcus terminator TaxID=2316733 RepID=A0A3A8J381_9BACT|nr:hypothetical protein [Corallococcus terminator]RKG89306.1 hypothetical protein D7V88_12840 [Corallococcus terminator]